MCGMWRGPSAATLRISGRRAQAPKGYARRAIRLLGSFPATAHRRRGEVRDRGGAVSLRLDVQLLGERAPVLLVGTDELRGALRRAGPFGGEAEGIEPLLDVGSL